MSRSYLSGCPRPVGLPQEEKFPILAWRPPNASILLSKKEGKRKFQDSFDFCARRVPQEFFVWFSREEMMAEEYTKASGGPKGVRKNLRRNWLRKASLEEPKEALVRWGVIRINLFIFCQTTFEKLVAQSHNKTKN